MTIITHLSDSSFTTFIEQHELVVVDIWAEWCFPCNIIDPVFEELAKVNLNKISFAKVDADANPGFRTQFNFSGIPSFLFFKGGKLFELFTGADEARLRKTVEKLLKSKKNNE
ncbi:MAG: thioredoxin family protein [Candidatus Kariarchaeaceae archaeon]